MKPIYIPVSVEQELPKKAHKVYFAMTDTCYGIRCYFNGTRFERSEYESKVTHWLKPITELSDLPEEWRAEILKESIEKINVCQYVSDNTTGMNCKHCGRSKFMH